MKNKAFDVNGGGSLRASTTNTPIIQQRNEANNNFLPLPYIGAGNQLMCESGQVFFVGPRSLSATYPGEFAVFQPTSANSGDSILSQVGPTVTGNHYSMKAQGQPSGSFIHALYNQADGATANAVFEIRTIAPTAGDPKIFMYVNGGDNWTLGVDNSDSDKFKICNSYGVLGSGDRFVIDANTVAFGLPPKLPSYTVADTPSASAAGAGSIIFVPDESGGAVPAFSDGTNWRRVTDRTVIS